MPPALTRRFLIGLQFLKKTNEKSGLKSYEQFSNTVSASPGRLFLAKFFETLAQLHCSRTSNNNGKKQITFLVVPDFAVGMGRAGTARECYLEFPMIKTLGVLKLLLLSSFWVTSFCAKENEPE
jgi:hypothetical protein